jgi:hypothetical protein
MTVSDRMNPRLCPIWVLSSSTTRRHAVIRNYSVRNNSLRNRVGSVAPELPAVSLMAYLCATMSQSRARTAALTVMRIIGDVVGLVPQACGHTPNSPLRICS